MSYNFRNSYYLSLITLLIITLFLPINISAQAKIFGKVIEDKTQVPLIGVHVYLAGTSIGAVTNEFGDYEFQTDLRGQFDLVVSFLGFRNQNKEVFLTKDDTLSFNFSLKENPFQLDEVEVSAKKDTEWQKQFVDFRRFFLGWDAFADQTVFENPEYIDFQWFGTNELIVLFRQPIRIKNYALGYTIELELKKIVFNPYDHTGYWIVQPRFEEMKANNNKQRRIWNKNRENAYKGSSNHFFRSLIKDDLKRDKFILKPRSNVVEEVKDEQLIRRVFPRDWKKIVRKYHIYRVVTYDFGIVHNPQLDRGGKVEAYEEFNSFEIKNPAGLIVVDDFGNIFNSEDVIFLGPWSRDRFAKTLPINFNK